MIHRGRGVESGKGHALPMRFIRPTRRMLRETRDKWRLSQLSMIGIGFYDTFGGRNVTAVHNNLAYVYLQKIL